MKLVPLQDNVLIEPTPAEKMTAGGIHIPDTATDGAISRGRVVAVGPGRSTIEGNLHKLVPTTVKVDDEVMYGKYGGSEITVEGKKLITISESSLICMVQK